MLFVAVIFAVFISGAFGDDQNDFYSFVVKDWEGNDFPLDQLRGKVTLVVNVASLCGFTEEHYEALVRLDNILSYDGYFRVLAFPSNQFGEQEPGSNREIVEFAMRSFQVEFPIFGKIDVVGDAADNAFKNLYQQSGVVPDWNFYKYLVDHRGKVLNAWGPKVSVESVLPEIQKAVREAAEADTEKSIPSKKIDYQYRLDENDPGLVDYEFEDEMSAEQLRDEL